MKMIWLASLFVVLNASADSRFPIEVPYQNVIGQTDYPPLKAASEAPGPIVTEQTLNQLKTNCVGTSEKNTMESGACSGRAATKLAYALKGLKSAVVYPNQCQDGGDCSTKATQITNVSGKMWTRCFLYPNYETVSGMQKDSCSWAITE